MIINTMRIIDLKINRAESGIAMRKPDSPSKRVR